MPSLLALPFQAYLEEDAHPVMRLHRFCDAMEILVRFAVVAWLGEVRRTVRNDVLPEPLLRVMRRRIERPAFGDWGAALASADRFEAFAAAATEGASLLTAGPLRERGRRVATAAETAERPRCCDRLLRVRCAALALRPTRKVW
jgi:hypothetical protein